MKKLVLAALAIGVMAACTKSGIQYEQPEEISLHPVAQKVTKAAIDGTAYPTNVNFNLSAWWADVQSNTSLENFSKAKNSDSDDEGSGVVPYISNGEFAYREDTENWGGWKSGDNGGSGSKYPYYWPTSGSLVFAGYSPASVTGGLFNFDDKKFIVEDFTQTYNLQTIDSQPFYDCSNTIDLMWSEITDLSYLYTDSSPVNMSFKHALSWLTFQFKLKDSNTPANWKVTSVVLKGIENQATFTATKGGNQNWEWGDETNVVNLLVFKSNTNDGTVIQDTTPQILETSPRGVLVIPQSCAAAKPATDSDPAVPAAAELEIKYLLKTPADDTKYINQSVTLPLELDKNNNKWEIGKHYVYTIVFGGNEILVKPEITDWTDQSKEITAH